MLAQFHCLVLPLLAAVLAEFAADVRLSAGAVPRFRLFRAAIRAEFARDARLPARAVPHFGLLRAAFRAKFARDARLAAGARPALDCGNFRGQGALHHRLNRVLRHANDAADRAQPNA